VVFIAGLAVLTIAGLSFFRTERGARVRAERPVTSGWAPFGLSVAA
jgi:hypothetical protein